MGSKKKEAKVKMFFSLISKIALMITLGVSCKMYSFLCILATLMLGRVDISICINIVYHKHSRGFSGCWIFTYKGLIAGTGP